MNENKSQCRRRQTKQNQIKVTIANPKTKKDFAKFTKEIEEKLKKYLSKDSVKENLYE